MFGNRARYGCAYGEKIMSSEVIVIIILVAVAAVSLVWLERHSRRNKQKEENTTKSE